jgi:hypothetical protein
VADETLASLSRRVTQLEALVAASSSLRHERDINGLMHRYIEACDHIRDAPLIASMFTIDATWDGTNRYEEFGSTTGQADIETMFAATPDVLPFTVHWLTNAIIDVAADGRTAVGQWEVLQAATFAVDDLAVWVGARYDNEFRRVGGTWLIHHLRYRDVFVTPFRGGGWDVTNYVSPFTGEQSPARRIADRGHPSS